MIPISRTLRHVAALDPRDRGVVLRTATALPMVAAWLRVASMSRIQRLLTSRRDPVTRADPERGREIGQLVNTVAAHHLYSANCLERSLVLWWLLGREGIPGELRFGVRPPEAGNAPDFHAWVELDGVPLNDRSDIAEEFIPFDQPIRANQRGRFV